MMDDDFIVSPRSWDNVEGVANTFRSELKLADVEYFPVVEVLELYLDTTLDQVRMEIWADNEMVGHEAYTKPDGSVIALSESVYVGACRNEHRPRFTIAHEVGHWIMHTGQVLTRVQRRQIKAYQSAELQAHQFAAELLMPRSKISNQDNTSTLQSRFGVSREAATLRLKFMRKRGFL